MTVAALILLGAAALSVGIPATVAPHSFYTGYPFLAHWVDRLPPYNEHLTTDVGELELAFGLMFLWAAWSRRRALIVPLCAGWAGSQTLHAIFHATHLSGFSVTDAIGELGGFVVLVGLAVAAAWLAVASGERGR
jgi:hypothetical protein